MLECEEAKLQHFQTGIPGAGQYSGANSLSDGLMVVGVWLSRISFRGKKQKKNKREKPKASLLQGKRTTPGHRSVSESNQGISRMTLLSYLKQSADEIGVIR